jgi:hypothetical protein
MYSLYVTTIICILQLNTMAYSETTSHEYVCNAFIIHVWIYAYK